MTTPSTPSIPEGFCQCGCGRETRIAKYTDRKIGIIQGKPLPFLKSHQNPHPANVACVCMECGSEFNTYRSRIALGRGKFCSMKCSKSFDRRRPLANRFWEKVNRTENPDDCWVFSGYIGEKGYGFFSIEIDGEWTRIGAHRVAWELTNGPQPKGMCVCHRCDNPPCCNPSHLFLGTVLENNADMVAKGRQARWEKNGQSKLTIENVQEIRRTYIPRKGMMKIFANQFNVKQGAIHGVLFGGNWKGIE